MTQQHSRFLSFTASSALSVAVACAGLGIAGQVDARPGGGGGPHGGGARTSVNHGGGGGANVNRGGNANVNRNANVNANRNVNANVNRNTNVNVNRNVNVVGGRGGVYDDYHPIATAAAVTATVAVTAAVVGSVVNTLPPSCVPVVMNGITYQQCGGAYYQPQYVGSQVNYVVVNP
ncbi:hypothetical protein WKW79_13545 [Variovorax robiniae]|uniref:Uncharacterized protein n=1 Tax=Variovorax robiniae TaxID=1836199 RepID=A0ABU8X915_9BURK